MIALSLIQCPHATGRGCERRSGSLGVSRVRNVLERAYRAARAVSAPVPPTSPPDPVVVEAERIKPLAWRQIDVYDSLHDLSREYADLAAGPDLTQFERKVFSQNGEDGVICEILRRVGPRSRRFVEIGVGDGTESNCLFLADVMGWSGIFIEAGAHEFEEVRRRYRGNPGITVLGNRVDPSNVDGVISPLTGAGLDVLSIDIDGNDYYIWRAIECVQPLLVVIEYNAGLGPDAQLVQPYDPDSSWDRTARYGASIASLRQLGLEKGYELVHSELTGNNAFFVQNEMAARVTDGHPPLRAANFWLNGEHPQPEADPAMFVDPQEN